MSIENPLITIVTASYMQGAYIKDCIESVMNQSHKNIEHIILDSCSQDETDAVVKSYLGKYNLTYISEKDHGQANAINKGFDLAKGDIVCWLNCDDFFIHQDVLANIVKLFNSFAHIDVITGNGYYVNEQKKTVAPIVLQKSKYVREKFMKYADYLLQPSTFWRKTNIRLDEKLHYTFDWKFFMDLYRDGFSFFYSQDYYSCYRIQEGSKTFINNSKRKKEVARLLTANKAGLMSRIWAWIVYYHYLVAEKTGISLFKSVITFLNEVLKRLTDGKIYSC